MKSLLFITLFTLGAVATAKASELDGSYKMASWVCVDGSQPATADVVSRIVDNTFLKITDDKMITTLKFDLGCEISWLGQFKIEGDILDLSEMLGVATGACKYTPQEKEPAITFTIKSTEDSVVFAHAPSPTDVCSTGSVRTYKRITLMKAN